MVRKMDGWMDVRMNGWMDGWMNGRTDRKTGAYEQVTMTGIGDRPVQQ